MVLKSKMKLNDTTAFDESVPFICQNTTRYDKNIGDYTCTPPCEKPKFVKNIVHDWNLMAKPEIDDKVIYSCTNGSKIVSKLDFANAIPNAPMTELELIDESNFPKKGAEHIRGVGKAPPIKEEYFSCG